MNDSKAESSTDNPHTPETGEGISSDAGAQAPAPKSVDTSRVGELVIEQLNDAHKKSVDRLQTLRLAIWLCGLLITLIFCGMLLYYAFRK